MLALAAVQDPATRQANKLELIHITNELMPSGKPAFLEMVRYPKVSALVQEMGEPIVLLILSTMVRDFCGSVNVSRNMNEDQMLEAAAMLLNECGNFRLEDYTVMFAMAKKGQLVKFYERIDLEVITAILDAYWEKRQEAGRKAQEEEDQSLEGLGPVGRSVDDMHPQDAKLMSIGDGIAGALHEMKDRLREHVPGINYDQAKKQIAGNPNYKNNYTPPQQ